MVFFHRKCYAFPVAVTKKIRRIGMAHEIE